MEYFIGIDVSLEASSVCVMDQGGAVVKETKVLNEPDALITFVHGLGQEVSCIGMEAGPLSQWLSKHLTEAGLTTVLMKSRQVKGALKAMPIKTDRRDALGIAQLLRMGWFRPVHCKAVTSQEIRALLLGNRLRKMASKRCQARHSPTCAADGHAFLGGPAKRKLRLDHPCEGKALWLAAIEDGRLQIRGKGVVGRT